MGIQAIPIDSGGEATVDDPDVPGIQAVPIAGAPAAAGPPESFYCTDEDIAVETSDFYLLCPTDAVDASGTDGTILPGDPWVFRSASVNFAAQGITPQSIIHIYSVADSGLYGARPGEAFAIDSVVAGDGHSLRLRRKGSAVGLGDPPGNPGETITGITFQVRTLRRTIERATREIDERFGISDLIADSPGQVFSDADKQVLNDLTVYTVLERRYIAARKEVLMPGSKDPFAEKAEFYRRRIEEVSSRFKIRLSGGASAVLQPRRYSRIAF